MSEKGKKIKGIFCEFYSIFGIFNMLLAENYILVEKIYVMSEEKIKKKLNGEFFFSCRA